MRSGRPLRFLRRIVGGWAASRLLLLAVPLVWTQAEGAPAVIAAIRTVIPIAEVVSAPIEMAQSAGVRIGAVIPGLSAMVAPTALSASPDFGGGGGGSPGPWERSAADALLASSLAFVHAPRESRQNDLARFAPGTTRPPVEAAMPIPEAGAGRWRGTSWLLWRPQGGEAAVPGGGQLGASQAGARVDYAIGQVAGGDFGAYGRVSAAVESPHAAEGAVGLAWRPSRGIPVTLAVERRQRLGPGGRSAMAAYVAGGLGPTSLGGGMELEGYGQAGIVGLGDPDGFVDGKLSITRRLTEQGAKRDVALGASLSGGAQPGASRLDIGPEVRFRLPLGNDRARLSAEWRERIAGDARPGSGPAFTLIGEF